MYSVISECIRLSSRLYTCARSIEGWKAMTLAVDVTSDTCARGVQREGVSRFGLGVNQNIHNFQQHRFIGIIRVSSTRALVKKSD